MPRTSVAVELVLLNSLLATVKALAPNHLQLIATSSSCRPSTALKVDPSAVNDFVQGLDTVLGNPTSTAAANVATAAAASSSSAVNMEISDAAIMMGGGVATMAVGGLAAFFTTNSNNEDEKKNQHEVQQSKSSSTELQAEVQSRERDPAVSTGEVVGVKPVEEPELIEAMEESTELSKNEELEIAASVKAEAEATGSILYKTDPILQESKQRGIFLQRILNKKTQLLEKANQKLRRQAAKLTSTETKLQETQSQLTAVTRSNQKLYADYKAEKEALEGMKEELVQAQNRYVELEQFTKAELKAMRESNQDLEDRFELEQNDKKRRTSALRETQWTLDRTSKQFSKTKLELMKTKAELDQAQQQLKSSNDSLEELQEEKESLRKLTGNIWKLSKDRARQRIGKLKGKFSRRNSEEEM